MRTIFFIIAVLSHTFVYSQAGGVKIKGRVYYEYSTSTRSPQQQQVSVRSTPRAYYPADFKVILFKAGSLSRDQQYVRDNKTRICANDQSFIRKYNPQFAYTNQNGEYEFRGLVAGADYILIFCDQQTQVSVVNTGTNRNITYTVKDKKVSL